MIVWKGSGWITAALTIVALGIGGGVAEGSTNGELWWLVLVTGLLAAVGNWFLGVYFNKTRPARQIEPHWESLNHSVRESLARGQFFLGGRWPRPASQQDAEQQAYTFLQQERARLNRGYNQHRLFWVPMQYMSLLIIVLSVLAAVSLMPK